MKTAPPPYRPRSPDEDQRSSWPLFLFLASVGLHVALFYTLHEMPEPESPPELIVYEVALEDPPEPEPEIEEEEPEPEPEPEPPPEPEEPPPEPEVPPPEPPPKKQPPKAKPKPQQPPPSDDLPPPPPIRLPDSQLVPSGSGSPVSVNPGGTTTSPGRIKGDPAGKPGGKPKSTGTGTGGTGKAPTGPKWAPKSDVFIKKMPLPKKRPPKLQCPASRDKGVYGTVVLSLDVRRDGTVRRVKVVRGIGSGCDEIAKKALKKMTLSPAMDTSGNKSDYAGLRYEYVFEPPS